MHIDLTWMADEKRSTMDDRSEWWDPKTAARVLKVSVRTVGRRCECGELEAEDGNPAGQRRKWTINPASVRKACSSAEQLLTWNEFMVAFQAHPRRN
jgi:hypothetical protein